MDAFDLFSSGFLNLLFLSLLHCFYYAHSHIGRFGTQTQHLNATKCSEGIFKFVCVGVSVLILHLFACIAFVIQKHNTHTTNGNTFLAEAQYFGLKCRVFGGSNSFLAANLLKDVENTECLFVCLFVCCLYCLFKL